jgi:deferrochelatase/peroxidase EfeB
MSDAVDFADIQGLVRFGYRSLTQASFLLLRVKDCDAARAWLAAAPVSSAATGKPPQTALQVALTREGLDALRVPAEVLSGFSTEFLTGMSFDANRARRLGDVADNDPQHWVWGATPRMPHVLLMVYAAPGLLTDFEQSVLQQCGAAFELMARLPTSDMDGVEPFGFVDGLSQPEPDWTRQRAVADTTQYEYLNLSCLGEYVLGYPNEYGAYTDRPLLDPASRAAAMLPRAEDAPGLADLGRNGSYLVMRQLRQDVQSFWRFLDEKAGGDATVRERWAAAMVGRMRDGKSLVDDAVADGNLNAFDYSNDPQGLRCPLGAHVRRVNPRNADLPAGGSGYLSRLIRILGFDSAALNKDRAAPTRFHRLLRRGREYGEELLIEQALANNAPTEETGLHFICLNANIMRQFEFVQNAWIMGTRFEGLAGEGDPLMGNRQHGPDGSPCDIFSMPDANGPDKRLTGLPRFVQVRGGAYFFLPGIRALRYLATVGS